MPEVAPGDLLWDTDPRAPGRCLEVTHVFDGYAYCRVIKDRMGARRSSVGHRRSIRLDRIKPTTRGYRHEPRVQT